MPLKFEKLNKKKHDRKQFDCGNERVNHYLQKVASQQSEVGGVICYCLVDEQTPSRILGYYSLHTIQDTLNHVIKRAPQHPIGCLLLGWMGVDNAFQGIGLGKVLLSNVFDRFVNLDPLFAALLVDPKTDTPSVVDFYISMGFLPCGKGRFFRTRKDIIGDYEQLKK